MHKLGVNGVKMSTENIFVSVIVHYNMSNRHIYGIIVRGTTTYGDCYNWPISKLQLTLEWIL